MKKYKKPKAQIAYEAYPPSQNMLPWDELSDWKQECWEEVVLAVSASPLLRMKRLVKKQ